MSRFLALLLFAFALPAASQVTPAANYSDMWYLPSESGWGVSITQHSATNQVFAVWYTFDPRNADPANPGRDKPLWIVMPGGTWTSPTTLQGTVFVTSGLPLAANTRKTAVGTFLFTFTGTANAMFSYDIAPPTGLAADDPAFGLPSFSGTKAITRQGF